MILAKVVGNVWSTKKDPTLVSWKLMLIKPLDPATGALTGKTALAVDGGFGAGIGDTVLVLDEGGGARMIMNSETAPVRTIICGVVDAVNIAETGARPAVKNKPVKKTAK